MSYLNFLIFFVLTPTLFLSYFFYKSKSNHKSYTLKGIFLLAILALVYTTPWDNYLVANDVWWYGKDRVLFVIGYVPFEEYCFFIIQTFLTGFWTFFCWKQSDRSLIIKKKPATKTFFLTTLLVAILFSVLLLNNEPTFYLSLITTWALPVLTLQLFFGFHHIHTHFLTLLKAALPPTLYLCLADAFAISDNIWSISKTYTTGIKFGPLPLEEALFFLITNLMVAQGLLLFLYMKDEIPKFIKPLKKI